MNRPELDGFSDPMAASLQLDTVTNRGELPETLNRKLEILRTKLEKTYGVQLNQWNRLNLEERVEMLQDVHNTLAATYGFTPVPVGIALLPPRRNGHFLRQRGLIEINVKLVAGNDNVQPLRTLFHESRHAYQWYLVQRFRQGPAFLSEAGCAQAQEWGDNFDDYKSTAKYSFQEYLNQPIEVDARSFAETIIKLLFGE